MTVRDSIPWQAIYARFVALESEMRHLRTLLLALQPGGTIVCLNPAPLGGLWAGVDIVDDLIESGRKSMFVYERKPLDI